MPKPHTYQAGPDVGTLRSRSLAKRLIVLLSLIFILSDVQKHSSVILLCNLLWMTVEFYSVKWLQNLVRHIDGCKGTEIQQKFLRLSFYNHFSPWNQPIWHIVYVEMLFFSSWLSSLIDDASTLSEITYYVPRYFGLSSRLLNSLH